MKSVCHFFPDVDVLPINGLEEANFSETDNDHHHYHLIFCNFKITLLNGKKSTQQV